MNKKLLVLAVSSALAGTAAYADTVNVNVYGKLYPQFQVSKADGATDPTKNVPNTHAVESSNSNIGFKGDADIGGGMKGWFQVETKLGLDTGDGAWSSRNSAAGLSGGFGNVFLGRWDTVYKQLGFPVSFLGLSSGNFVSNSATAARAFSGSGSTSFHLRRSNYIQYETPEMGGVQFLVGYGPDEDRTIPAPIGSRNASLISAGVKWEAGPLYVSLAHEIHNDFDALPTTKPAGTATDSKDTGTRLSVAYKLPTGTKIGVTAARMDYDQTSAAGTGKYKHNAYDLTVTQKVGKTSFAASFANSDKGSCSVTGATCSVNNTGANQINLGVRHDFNKRVGVFGLLSKLTNESAAKHNNTDLVIGTGADPQTIAAGVIVTF